MTRNGSLDDTGVCCRAVTLSDISPTCQLMDELKIAFAGLKGREIYEALCRDAVMNKGIILQVAVMEQCVVGFAAAVIDAESYWRNFIWRHPFLSMIAVFKRIVKVRISSAKSAWAISSVGTARILCIAVAEHFRNKGVGTCLYRSLFDILSQRSVRLVEAHIDAQNVAAIQLYTRVGGQVAGQGNFLLGRLNLAGSRDAERQ